MIDTHIHILPAVDDGADDLETSRLMALQALGEGVTDMIVTPHFVNNRDYQSHASQQFELLSNLFRNENIDLKLQLGNEIHLTEENVDAVFSGLANTMGDSNYLLIELPSYHFYDFHETFLMDLINQGYRVILAHIERYRVFQEKPQKLGHLIEQGMFAQVTAKYIIERKSRKKALNWIDTGWIHIIASDAHDLLYRPPTMKKAHDIVEKRFGECAASWLFKENPRAIMENREMNSIITCQKKWHLF